MALSMLLRMAVLAGVQAAVHLRIRVGDDVNTTDAKGRTPLILAASKGHVKICMLLLECGADLWVTDASGETALAAANRCGHTDLVSLLRKHLTPASIPCADGAAHLSPTSEFADDSDSLCFCSTPPYPTAEALPVSTFNVAAAVDDRACQIPDDNETFDLSGWETDDVRRSRSTMRNVPSWRMHSGTGSRGMCPSIPMWTGRISRSACPTAHRAVAAPSWQKIAWKPAATC